METTESSNRRYKPTAKRGLVRCAVRKAFVALTPEEKVRQAIISTMVDRLGYPQSCIAVEVSLQHLPHLMGKGWKVPLRRADILCFGKGIHPEYDLYPLLLVECKAVSLTEKALSQVTGYNHFLQASYIALANQQEVLTGRYDKKTNRYQYRKGLPSYQELFHGHSMVST